MELPNSAATAKAEFNRRLRDLDGTLTDDAPDWAITAFLKAVASSPFMLNWIGSAECKPFFRGFCTAAITDMFLPMWRKVVRFSESEVEAYPTDATKKASVVAAKKMLQRLESGIKNVTGEYCLGDSHERELFLKGMETYKRTKPQGSGTDFGNLATMPHLYIALFWREFARIQTTKEAYDALLCMFDRKEALAGSFESFRKRITALGLKFPVSSVSS